MTFTRLAAALFLAAALPALPAAAQQAKAPELVVLVEGPTAAPHTVLGQVKAEYHQKTMLSKLNPRDEVNKQLRAAAAKLGADAVVGIAYDNSNPMTSKKGFLANGTAVKFDAPQVAAASVAAPLAAALPAAAASAPAPAIIAPAAPIVGGIALSETDASAGRAYTMLGVISAAAAPNLDKTPRQVLDEDFRAKAKAMGADAVIMIRYDATGASAQGLAVKYK